MAESRGLYPAGTGDVWKHESEKYPGTGEHSNRHELVTNVPGSRKAIRHVPGRDVQYAQSCEPLSANRNQRRLSGHNSSQLHFRQDPVGWRSANHADGFEVRLLSAVESKAACHPLCRVLVVWLGMVKMTFTIDEDTAETL